MFSEFLEKHKQKLLKSSDSAKGPTSEHSEGEVLLTASHGRLQSSCKDLCLGCTWPFNLLTSLPAEHSCFCFLKLLPFLQCRECAFSYREELCVRNLKLCGQYPVRLLQVTLIVFWNLFIILG